MFWETSWMIPCLNLTIWLCKLDFERFAKKCSIQWYTVYYSFKRKCFWIQSEATWHSMMSSSFNLSLKKQCCCICSTTRMSELWEYLTFSCWLSCYATLKLMDKSWISEWYNWHCSQHFVLHWQRIEPFEMLPACILVKF